MTKEQIANVLKNVRLKAGFTQKQAAEAIGRNQQTLASWEKGQSQPDTINLLMLFKTYGQSIDENFNLKNTTHNLTMTSEEKKLVYTYRSASKDDKDVVDTVLRKYKEKEKIKQKSDFETSSQIFNLERPEVINYSKSAN